MATLAFRMVATSALMGCKTFAGINQEKPGRGGGPAVPSLQTISQQDKKEKDPAPRELKRMHCTQKVEYEYVYMIHTYIYRHVILHVNMYRFTSVFRE